MSMYNERVFNILLESREAINEKAKTNECNEECHDFQDTIGRIGDAHLVPDSIKMNVATVPVLKVECGKGECGENECGKACKEEYYIDHRLLDIYMEDNDINDAAEAIQNICEWNHIDVNNVTLVIECDEINKGLMAHAKKYLDCGLLRRCHDQICNCLNAGIKVAKRS